MTRSTYTVRTLPGFVLVTDLDRGRSVTNDAEHVIADLLKAGYDLETNRLLYRAPTGFGTSCSCGRASSPGFMLCARQTSRRPWPRRREGHVGKWEYRLKLTLVYVGTALVIALEVAYAVHLFWPGHGV